MTDSAEYMFNVLTPLGFRVHVTYTYWHIIITIKHPSMAGREVDVQEALQNPEEIRVSRSDPQVYLFYTSERPNRWVCAVAKHEHEDGFLITAYQTDAIKEGEQLWHK